VPIYAKFSLAVSSIVYSAIAEITFASFLVTTISKNYNAGAQNARTYILGY